MTLRKLVSMNILSEISKIEEISIKAQKEFAIRNDLDRMYKEWDLMKFEFKEMKNNPEVKIIQNFEDFLNTCDEHTGVTTSLYYSS